MHKFSRYVIVTVNPVTSAKISSSDFLGNIWLASIGEQDTGKWLSLVLSRDDGML